MIIAFSLSTITSANAESVPEWVKNNAGWWANEQISDSAFIDGIEFLIKEGIIQINFNDEYFDDLRQKKHNEIVNDENLTYTEKFVLIDKNAPFISGYRGATFDGESVYFSPYYNNYDRKTGMMLKYNIDLPFNNSNSWEIVNLGKYGIGGFQGVIYNNGFVYYVPYVLENDRGTTFLRYDISKEFTDVEGAWLYNKLGNAGMFEDGIAVDNFIYYAPHYDQNEELSAKPLRYDTTAASINAYAQYPSELEVSYIGASFDGDFIYYAPYESGYAEKSFILIYDIDKEFTDPDAWNEIEIPYSRYSGVGFDGTQIVMAPHCFMIDDNIEKCSKILFLNKETQKITYSDKIYGSYNGVIETDIGLFLVPHMSRDMQTEFLMIKDEIIHSFYPSIATGGYWGGTYDGRHVYYTPYNFVEAPDQRNGEFLRYDTTKNFDDELAWEMISFAVTDFYYNYEFGYVSDESDAIIYPEEFTKFK